MARSLSTESSLASEAARTAEFAWSCVRSEAARREGAEEHLERLVLAARAVVDQACHGDVTINHARQWDSEIGRLAAVVWDVQIICGYGKEANNA